MSSEESLERAELVRSVHDGRKLGVLDFSRELLGANDLDPVYVILWEAIQAGYLPPTALKKWLLAYWCFYHVGTASEMAHAPDELGYWGRMKLAAGSKDYPRSAERRHFRGKNAETSVEWLKSVGVHALFEPLIGHEHHVKWITSYIQTWKGFGPWISFKVADMLERLSLSSVTFDLDTAMYDSPREAAELLWDVEENRVHFVKPLALGEWAVGWILDGLAAPESNERGRIKVYSQTPLNHVPKMSSDPKDNATIDAFRGQLAGYAPPRYDRPLGVQEAETILCKWKSYLGGHYHVGEDVAACRKGLLRFARCPLSQQLIRAGKAGGLW